MRCLKVLTKHGSPHLKHKKRAHKEHKIIYDRRRFFPYDYRISLESAPQCLKLCRNHLSWLLMDVSSQVSHGTGVKYAPLRPITRYWKFLHSGDIITNQ